MENVSGGRLKAFVPRTAALFILLYQIRLFAADMADTPFFAAALAGALGAALFVYRKKIPPFQALLIFALIPWTIRLFIALPRWFIPGAAGGAAILLDSLLLNLDRNNFSALLPFYWVAFSSYFSLKSRIFLRADIIAADTLFLVIFSIAPTASMEAYPWPILMIGLFALVFFLQILALVFSVPPELKLRRKESILAGSFLFALVFFGGAFFIRPFQEKAVERGGGLIEPNLFRFDFSQFLRLESEISVSDDLVLIVKKDSLDSHKLLRRYTLSGYGAKQGFSRLEDIDEAAHPRNLPGRPAVLPVTEIENFRVTEQEYYLVNFDSSAFIGMNMPVEITPFETWDASSFNSAYAVKSHTSEARPFELIEAVRGEPGPENLRMSAEEYAVYTNYGGDETIASFAREIVENPEGRRFGTENSPSYWEKIQMVYTRLKYGEYRYSLKPGIAPDGDQLKYFLFTSKKGYCSYYAFAFTLMLRSLGIPSRVAAGFFVDLSTEAFNYYPVRQDMAHAWVEVWFPGYGWIEYDPTSEEVAEGEEYRFSDGTPPELFERLMKEILENRSRLKIKDEEDEKTAKGNLASFGRETLRFLRRTGLFLAAAFLAFLFLVTRSGFLLLASLRGNPRKKALCLWAHARRRLALAGLRRNSGVSGGSALGEAEWAKALDSRFDGIYSLYRDSAAARFAPAFSGDESLKTADHYRVFSGSYRKAVSPGRRLLAWILPPLALFLPPGRRLNKKSSAAGALLLLFTLFLIRGETGRAQDASLFPADLLYDDARAAEAAENWERAIELFGEGSRLYPLDIRFPWALGNLYYQRGLYRLAWDEYRAAEEIGPTGPDLFFTLATTAGHLNMNDISAAYFERVLALNPDDREAIASLSWMYFKLHRLEEGEALLLSAFERVGEDPDFSMTLGTVYSDMFRYEEAKENYLKAISGAEDTGDRLFAALAHYNLSILESRFYLYSLAWDQTDASLRAMDRASGRLARGELNLRRMELSRALAEYQAGYGMDSSPLSKLNLAEVFQIGGRLAEAALYAEDCLKAKDDSWMLNYGIDPDRYKRDIHEILKEIYDGLLKAETFAVPSGFKEKTRSFFRAVSYRFRREVHRHLFRKYGLVSAGAYDAAPPSGGEIHVEALLQYFAAFEAYPGRALAYLKKARDFEEPLISGSLPSYRFDEGRLRKDKKILADTLTEFDALWERDKIADVYAELARLGSRAERNSAAERLFAINRGALLRNGLRLPVELRLEAGAAPGEGILKKALKAAGLEAVTSVGLDGSAPRYTLRLGFRGEVAVSCELYDGGRGIVLWKQNLPFPASSRAERAAFGRALRDGIFNAF